MNETVRALHEAVLKGDRDAAKAKTTEALDGGVAPAAILADGMIGAMDEVGRRFEEGTYFVPEMLIAARAMKEALALLKPHLVTADVASAGRVVAGTVQGDLHDIGKNLVCMMLEGAGFEVNDLGTDVPAEAFVEALRTDGADVVALSALLTTTMPRMRGVIEALEREGLRGDVRVIVGGAPLTEAYAREIEADGYAPDAPRAVALAKSMIT